MPQKKDQKNSCNKAEILVKKMSIIDRALERANNLDVDEPKLVDPTKGQGKEDTENR